MRRTAAALVTVTLVCLASRPVGATQKFGPVQLSGNLQSANIVRTPDADTLQ